ncbi:MAG: sigma-70 family RNA polymerase sigma factor [Planctomycetota bacterium]
MDRRTLTPDDAELLRQGAAGDRDALDRLVRRHVAVIHAAALRRSVPGVPASDVTQAALLVLLKRLGSARRSAERDGTLVPWLLATVRNVTANAAKRQRRRDYHETAACRDDLAGGDPSDVLAWREVAEVLDAAILALPRQDRSAITLKFFDRCSTAEIASRLDITESAARKRVSRAVGRLRDRIDRRSVGVEHATLVGLLTTHAVSASPPAVSLTAAGASTAAVSIAQGTLTMIKLKLTAAVVAGATLAAGTATVVAFQRTRLPEKPAVAAVDTVASKEFSLPDMGAALPDEAPDRFLSLGLYGDFEMSSHSRGADRETLHANMDAIGPQLMAEFRNDGQRAKLMARGTKLYFLPQGGQIESSDAFWEVLQRRQTMLRSEPSGGFHEVPLPTGTEQLVLYRTYTGEFGTIRLTADAEAEPRRVTGVVRRLGAGDALAGAMRKERDRVEAIRAAALEIYVEQIENQRWHGSLFEVRESLDGLTLPSEAFYHIPTIRELGRLPGDLPIVFESDRMPAEGGVWVGYLDGHAQRFEDPAELRRELVKLNREWD